MFFKIAVAVLAVLAGLAVGQSSAAAAEPGGRTGSAARAGDQRQALTERIERLRKAVGVHQRNTHRLRRLRGVVASGTGLDAEGRPVIRVFLERAGAAGIPKRLEDIDVRTEISGRFYARRGLTCESSGDGICESTERWPLPVPIGVSAGHPTVGAGTIGARLTDGANFFMLSNNHVLAAANSGFVGDPIVQPGVVDGGHGADDAIATLADYQPIVFCDPLHWMQAQAGHDCSSSQNTIDAAIALTTRDEIGPATPAGLYGSIAGYGAPRSRFNPAFDDGDLSDLLGVRVRKYGATTALTMATVSTVDATVEICYDPNCESLAIFVDQIIITADDFSAGGDSGALIVDAARRPIGLLFAGNNNATIANRIDRVMQRFAGLSIDGGRDEAASVTAGPMLALRRVAAHTDAWTTVTLDQDYGTDMVVVCTPNYDRSDPGPAVVRVRNAAGSSFDVGLARPWFEAAASDTWSANVHCMIVRAGAYSKAVHGVTMEAVKLANVTTTDHAGSWVGVPRGYANAYSAPVVVGQVMDATAAVPGAIGDWSVFWARGPGRDQPPSADTLFVGRHTGEDRNGRPPETLGYVVIEQGAGTIDGVAYRARVGAARIRGVGNSPPYSYAVAGVATPSTGILGQAGMAGGNGGWPLLYGPSPLTSETLRTAIDEDRYRDAERSHARERVGYIVFD